jgi:hypothetical protein
MSAVVMFTLVVSLVSLFAPPAMAQPAPQRDRQQEGRLKVGDPAPDFELARLDGKGKVKLSSFQGRQPVVLIFGSYT